MAKRKYYPSTPKSKQNNQTDWNRISQDDYNQMPYDITPMVNFQDAAVNKQFSDWKNKFQDEWINNVASINAHNSIAQYNEYILNRVSYVECSHLSIDTIINNAITKFANGCIRKGGEIILGDDVENSEDLIIQIEKRFKELGGLEKINELIKVCLTYGSAYLFIDVNGKDLTKPLVFSSSVFEKNKISNLQVIPPYGMGASAVETANMLDKNYMRPSQWYVQGGGTVDISRLIELIIFDCPNLIKPIFNFGGISLCQFMKNYVSTADSTRQSLADIMLRYKTDIIQSNLTKVNPEDAKARAGAINRHRNNLGLLLLTEDEVFQQVNTPIAGLENISAHQMEYVSVAGRTPATILFGLTPAGLNATGEFELDSYYDELASLQNSKIKPAIEQILYMICLELGHDIKPEYKFNELKKDNELTNAQVQGTYIDNATKLKDGGFLTEEQVMEYLKSKDVIADNIEYTEEEIDLDTPEDNPIDIPNSFSDSNEQGTYVSMELVNNDEFYKWFRKQGIKTLRQEDFHCTIAYSKKEFNHVINSAETIIKPNQFIGIEPLGNDGAMVLKFNSDEMQKRFNACINEGATYDYPQYIPHITISYDAKDMDLSKIKMPDFNIILKWEKSEPLDLNWKEKLK